MQVHDGEPVYVYNVAQDKWLSAAERRFSQTAGEARFFPTLSASPTDAVLLYLRFYGSSDRALPLRVEQAFTLETEENLSAEVYLEVLGGAFEQASARGLEVVYDRSAQPAATHFVFRDAKDPSLAHKSATRQAVRLGWPFHWFSPLWSVYLSQGYANLLGVQHYTAGQLETWLLVPGSAVYTCTPGAATVPSYSCRRSSARQNLDLKLRCRPAPAGALVPAGDTLRWSCADFSGRAVYASEADCDFACGPARWRCGGAPEYTCAEQRRGPAAAGPLRSYGTFDACLDACRPAPKSRK